MSSASSWRPTGRACPWPSTPPSPFTTPATCGEPWARGEASARCWGVSRGCASWRWRMPTPAAGSGAPSRPSSPMFRWRWPTPSWPGARGPGHSGWCPPIPAASCTSRPGRPGRARPSRPATWPRWCVMRSDPGGAGDGQVRGPPGPQQGGPHQARLGCPRAGPPPSAPPWSDLRERAACIRRETLGDLEGYLGQLSERVEANGGVVHRAGGPAEALGVIEEIATANGVELVVKSKSMATEEIHLNHHLEAMGIDVVETDLGEYILQLADERPSHIVAPAVHRSKEDIAALFEQVAGGPVGHRPEDLAAFARQRLRQDFHRADMGISGVNFAAADTGTLALVTNEGNGRMVTSQPRIH